MRQSGPELLFFSLAQGLAKVTYQVQEIRSSLAYDGLSGGVQGVVSRIHVAVEINRTSNKAGMEIYGTVDEVDRS